MLLMAVLASSGCASAAPSCASTAQSDLAEFSRQLERAGVVGQYEVIDDCESSGSTYVNFEVGDLAGLDDLGKPPWMCIALMRTELDAPPHDDVGFTCEQAARRYEVTSGAVGGQAQGQVWDLADLTDE